MFIFIGKLLVNLAGYNSIVLRHSPNIKNSAMMAGTLMLLQLLLIFFLGLATAWLFFHNRVFITVIGLVCSSLWYYCLHISVINLQKHRSFLSFIRILIFNFLAGTLFSTIGLVCIAVEASAMIQYHELANNELLMPALKHVLDINDSLQFILFKVFFYLGVGVFILLPYGILYMNHKSSYYTLLRTYNLFKSHEIL